MMSLVQNFVQTYDQEAIVQREALSKTTTDIGEAKLLGSCLEQKVHYLERELNKVQSMQQMTMAKNSKPTNNHDSEESTEKEEINETAAFQDFEERIRQLE